jgi:hypothetical protein
MNFGKSFCFLQINNGFKILILIPLPIAFTPIGRAENAV